MFRHSKLPAHLPRDLANPLPFGDGLLTGLMIEEAASEAREIAADDFHGRSIAVRPHSTQSAGVGCPTSGMRYEQGHDSSGLFTRLGAAR